MESKLIGENAKNNWPDDTIVVFVFCKSWGGGTIVVFAFCKSWGGGGGGMGYQVKSNERYIYTRIGSGHLIFHNEIENRK